MKLYTEEQVIGIYRDGFNDGLSHRASMEDLVIYKYQPIELPSDEEIAKMVGRGGCDYEGAKWMKNQILNQTK